MPNQPSKDKWHTTLSIPKPLLAQIDAIARQQERSRNQVIVRLLRESLQNGVPATNCYQTTPQP
jgi:metal-responsive CopG/Arc/MetJ family transcriptional regulator